MFTTIPFLAWLVPQSSAQGYVSVPDELSGRIGRDRVGAGSFQLPVGLALSDRFQLHKTTGPVASTTAILLAYAQAQASQSY